MGFNGSDIPKASSAIPGMNQGPAGTAQGFNGAAIGSSMGSQIGMQRDQLGGMKPPGGVENPFSPAIDGLNKAQMPNVPGIDLEALFSRIMNKGTQTGQVGTQGSMPGVVRN